MIDIDLQPMLNLDTKQTTTVNNNMQKQTFILVDSMNMFFRAKHVARGNDMDMKIGMAMHIMFNSVKKAWRDFNGTHVIFCLEGRSWRKDFYTPYKANRKVIADKRSPREQEDDELFFEAYNDMLAFLDEKTNSSVVRQGNAEADDMIATWIQQHPEDNHIIVSSDTDFHQLIALTYRSTMAYRIRLLLLQALLAARLANLLLTRRPSCQ